MRQKHSTDTRLYCEKCCKLVPESDTIESFFYERLVNLAYALMTASTADNDTFASLMRRATHLLNITDQHFAKMLGISRSTATRWMKELSVPHPAVRPPIFNKLSDLALQLAQEQRLMHRYTKRENAYKNPPGVIGYCPIDRTILCGVVREPTALEYFIAQTTK